MKKITYVLILFVTLLSAFACGKASNTSTGKQTEEQVTKDLTTETTSRIITEEEMQEARFYEDVELLEPENEIIMAGTFKVKISEEIADKIYYVSHDTSVDLFFKDDISYFYDDNMECVVYKMPKLCTISADTSVYRLISGPASAWILGDEDEIQALNSYVQAVLGQVCVLTGRANTCPKEVIVEVNGMVHGSLMRDEYVQFEDMLKIEEHLYYILEFPTDEQLDQEENKTEYISIRSSLLKNSKIME